MFKNDSTLAMFVLAIILLLGDSTPCAAEATAQTVFKYADWKEVESFSAEGTAVDHGWTKQSDAYSWVDADRYLSVRETFDLIRPPPHTGASNAMYWDIQNGRARGNVLQHSNGGSRFRQSRSNHAGAFDDGMKKGGSLRIDFATGKWQLVTPGAAATKVPPDRPWILV